VFATRFREPAATDGVGHAVDCGFVSLRSDSARDNSVLCRECKYVSSADVVNLRYLEEPPDKLALHNLQTAYR